MAWQKLPILAYHKITNKIGWGVTSVPIRFFYEQMKYLHDNQYETIAPDQLDELPENSAAEAKKILLTFDDADESVFENAFPIMKKFGFTGTVFVIADFVGKKDLWDAKPFGLHSNHMSWKQLKILLDNGWKIGSHSLSHRDLTSLSEENLTRELRLSKQILEQNLDTEISTISFPFNHFNRKVLGASFAAGYKKGFILGKCKFSNHGLKEMAIPRLAIYLFDFSMSFRRKLQGREFDFRIQNIISNFSLGSILWNKFFKKSD